MIKKDPSGPRYCTPNTVHGSCTLVLAGPHMLHRNSYNDIIALYIYICVMWAIDKCNKVGMTRKEFQNLHLFHFPPERVHGGP